MQFHVKLEVKKTLDGFRISTDDDVLIYTDTLSRALKCAQSALGAALFAAASKHYQQSLEHDLENIIEEMNK